MSSAKLSDAVSALLHEYAPGSLVLAGQLADSLAQSWLENHTQCIVTRLDIQSDGLPSADLRADFAIVTTCGQGIANQTGHRLLARLRDLTVNQFALVTSVPAVSGWSRNDLAAFALDHLGRFEHQYNGEDLVDLYGYDLRRYKHTPDWLNADYWANPERWNKERW